MMLIQKEELVNYKSKDKIPFQCQYCKCEFFISKNMVMAKLNGNRKNKGKYCSLKCYHTSMIKSIETQCTHCKNIFKKQKCEFKRSKNHFCSRSCSASYNNTHKKFGIRRSKLEKWLEENLTKSYSSLEIHFNRKDAIDSELDIYIPSLKLAFELNGILHYKPIYGEGKLKYIQENDSRKIQMCLNNEIELHIIDTYNNKYLKNERNEKFLNIIKNLIDNKSRGFTP